MKTATYELQRFDSDAAMAEAVATCWRALIGSHSGPFLMALSGGRIANQIFSALAQKAKSQPMAFDPTTALRVDGIARNRLKSRLDCVHFFWADERCVPPDHPDSNFAAAYQRLFSPLNIPSDRIHRIRGEEEPAQAARDAEAALRQLALDRSGNLPVLDLVLLGMGEDGHVASLFPGNLARDTAAHDVYLPVVGPKPPPQRISLSYAAIVAARETWVIVSGAGKEAALHDSLQPNGRTPLARVLHERVRTRILTTVTA